MYAFSASVLPFRQNHALLAHILSSHSCYAFKRHFPRVCVTVWTGHSVTVIEHANDALLMRLSVQLALDSCSRLPHRRCPRAHSLASLCLCLCVLSLLPFLATLTLGSSSPLDQLGLYEQSLVTLARVSLTRLCRLCRSKLS